MGGGGGPGVASSSSTASSSFFVAAGANQFGIGPSTRVLPPPASSYFSSEGSNILPPLGSSPSELRSNTSAYYPPPLPSHDNHLQQPPPHHQTLTQPGWVPFPHPFLTSKPPAQPQPPPIPAWPFGTSSSSSSQSHSYTTSAASFANETNPVAPSPSTLSAPTSIHDSTFLSPSGEEGGARDEARRQSSVAESSGGVLGEQATVGGDGGHLGFEGMFKQMENAAVEVAPDAGLLDSDSAQFLRDLLWPGFVFLLIPFTFIPLLSLSSSTD